MSLTCTFTSLAFIFAASTIAGAAESNANLQERSSLLEARQGCENPSWVPICPGSFPCVPPGALCCSDGISYAIPPETCPDGTQPIITAPTGAAPTAAATSTVFTAPAVSLTFFTTEFTWSYWYYYYTYIEIYSTTELASTEVTTTTTVSVSATDSAQASILFDSLSATLVFPTPTQTATVLSGSAPASAAATPSASSPAFTGLLPTSITASSTVPTGGGFSLGFTASLPSSTGSATSPGASVMTPWTSGERFLGLSVVLVGFLMLWL